jgi:hypothetical protein
VAGLLLSVTAGCAGTTAASAPAPAGPPPAAQTGPQAGPQAGPGTGEGGTARSQEGARQPRPYARVVTPDAVTQRGLFTTHRIGDRILFEIPRAELDRDQMVLIRTAAGGETAGFFGRGPTRFVRWERSGNRILLREQSYEMTAEPGAAIERAVSALRTGPIVAAFAVESWGPDSTAVIDATRLFTTIVTRFTGVEQVWMRNLVRVAASLLRVAERPGEDYTLLRELYGSTVGKWGRYNGHVAAIIGGAESQERLGTGVRFTPMPRARQQEAMRYLEANAFRVPRFLLDTQVLRRIEQEGAVARIRQAQAGVLNTLFARGRLDRMIEYEAFAVGPREAYTVADMLGDLRRGVWTELDQSAPNVDVFRRNLQRAYLDAVELTLNPPPPPQQQQAMGGAMAQRTPQWTNDARAILRGELRELDELAERPVARTSDPMTRLHLRDVRMEIERLLDPTAR